MAAFGDVGAACAEPYCGTQDFLPFQCDACSKMFCREHFRHSAHRCTAAAGRDRQVVVCPQCRVAVPVAADGSDALQGHVCATENLAVSLERCAARGCKEQLGAHNMVKCWRCRQAVCIRHRFEDDHPCVPVDEAVKAALAAVSQRMDAAEFAESTKTLVKVLGNIVAEPGNEKFRTLKKSNAIVKDKLRHPACLEALQLCGFRDGGDTWVCPATVDLSLMKKFASALQNYRPPAAPAPVPAATSTGGYTAAGSGTRLVNGVIVRNAAPAAAVRQEAPSVASTPTASSTAATPTSSLASASSRPPKTTRDFARRGDVEASMQAQQAQLAAARQARKEEYRGGPPGSGSSQVSQDAALARRLAAEEGSAERPPNGERQQATSTSKSGSSDCTVQ
eukprot:TRINITY_DN45162_c0_g1_i1.p1 TRINITY_DN45162_c0_g1~~TRINITY_DN45162_c0_g1_i1.p1  ORF type:complete len:393 (+),score=101.40 TRINITY_DN45162_c0_g1_i1:78-1256(+)